MPVDGSVLSVEDLLVISLIASLAVNLILVIGYNWSSRTHAKLVLLLNQELLKRPYVVVDNQTKTHESSRGVKRVEPNRLYTEEDIREEVELSQELRRRHEEALYNSTPIPG